ncbi:MAG: hypothetical protein KAI29_16210, partial [Cyclobacteriaceae bacterium]|nr:hypothetical protein [Cyclobacteriaceae bacterium]
MMKLFLMMKRINQIIFYCIILVFGSCNSNISDLGPPNIVWITSEDNSKHYMKLFDENGVETPEIQTLADHGVIFT